jgi:hypothetical protein
MKCPEVKSEAKIGKDLRRNRYEYRTWMKVTVSKERAVRAGTVRTAQLSVSLAAVSNNYN